MLEDRRTVTVGLDVHKSSVRLAAVSGGEVLRERTLAYDHDELLGEIGSWPEARVCQEAGPTGFGLHRALLGAGIDSVIVAPGLVPSRPGDRVKTDKRDARRLAGLHAAGLLTEIYVPTAEHEALRDLVRAREDARLDDYLFAVDQLDRRVGALEQAIDLLAKDGPHRELIARLRCMRGIDTLTAIGLVAEVGDFTRFETAEQFMSFTGLVPSERSSGESRRQGSITKAGSAHARRLLVEAAWNSRRRPTVSYELGRRQTGQDPAVLEHAWRAQQRLHRRWQRMAGRGKPHQKIVVASARELAGFVWAIATCQPLRTA